MRAHLDLQGGSPHGVLLPIHWGTFNLAPHAWAEPAEWTKDAGDEADQPLAFPRPGEPFEPTGILPVEPWWRPLSPALARTWRLAGDQAATGPAPAARGDLDLAGER